MIIIKVDFLFHFLLSWFKAIRYSCIDLHILLRKKMEYETTFLWTRAWGGFPTIYNLEQSSCMQVFSSHSLLYMGFLGDVTLWKVSFLMPETGIHILVCESSRGSKQKPLFEYRGRACTFNPSPLCLFNYRSPKPINHPGPKKVLSNSQYPLYSSLAKLYGGTFKEHCQIISRCMNHLNFKKKIYRLSRYYIRVKGYSFEILPCHTYA